jgi:TetR/AcrR family transcriptional regulator
MSKEGELQTKSKGSQSYLRLFEGGVPDALAEQENRERILMAAAALFAGKGYAGTAIREIVEAAGVTKPTLYYYFKNKEDLYVKLMDEAMEAFSQIMEESLIQSGTMKERLASLFCNAFQLFREYVDCVRLVNTMMYGSQGSTPQYDYTASKEHFENVLAEVLRLGIAEGELLENNMKEAMLLLVSLMRSIQVTLTMKPDPLFSLDTIRGAIDLIFDGAGERVSGT